MPRVGFGAEPLRAPRQIRLKSLGVATLLLGCAALSGCHNRAYSDLYIENMAAEIRDLEDQLYEYDHQYRVLEQELDGLRHENSRLRGGELRLSPSESPSTDPNQPLEFYPRTSPIVPEPAMSAEEVEPNPQSILEDQPPASGTNPFPPNELPSPRNLSPPSNGLRDTSPETNSGNSLNFDQLVPPTIEAGEPMPPPIPSGSDRVDAGPPGGSDALELNLSRVKIPAQLASRRAADDSSGGQQDGPQIGPAAITPAVEKVTDTRVVELAFHPSLSRAANFDQQTDDDGLYLVLQPRNEKGQMVPIAADLSVVVLDPAREGNAARIGRWDYSTHEVKSKLEPIGTSQGIHLTLPWNGPDPAADRVLVFVRYTFPDGRQVIGEKTFFVSSDNGLKTVWSPRGRGSVVPASASSPTRSQNSNYQAPQGLQQSTPTGQSPNVVRPTSGSVAAEPAPRPY